MFSGTLSTDVFEPRTSTGSCIFPSLERFDAIAFVTSNRRHKKKSFPVRGKKQNHAKKENIRLPVAIRGSKTSVLFPDEFCATCIKRSTCIKAVTWPFPNGDRLIQVRLYYVNKSSI